MILMMEAASTSETLVNFYQTTRRNNPEDSHLHTHRHENLKYHSIIDSFGLSKKKAFVGHQFCEAHLIGRNTTFASCLHARWHPNGVIISVLVWYSKDTVLDPKHHH
jgi:hypothetical protein